jgi:hypothetical protein
MMRDTRGERSYVLVVAWFRGAESAQVEESKGTRYGEKVGWTNNEGSIRPTVSKEVSQLGSMAVDMLDVRRES